MQQLIDFGVQLDLLTQNELDDYLDAELETERNLLAGVKAVEQSFMLGTIGSGQQTFSTPPQMVAPGLAWAVMTVAAELSASNVVHIYKQIPVLGASNAPTGAGRVIGSTSGAVIPSQQFSKGQLMLRGGDQLTLVAGGAANLLSIYLAGISIPAERIGELLL